MSNKIKKIQQPIIPNSDLIKKINDDIYRIRINIQLRSIGVKDILVDRENFRIISDHFSVFVPHHDNVYKIVDGTCDQLLDPDYDLPAYIIKKIVNYVYSIIEEIDSIIGHFKWTLEKQ